MTLPETAAYRYHLFLPVYQESERRADSVRGLKIAFLERCYTSRFFYAD
jgi:hypothetical protein